MRNVYVRCIFYCHNNTDGVNQNAMPYLEFSPHYRLPYLYILYIYFSKGNIFLFTREDQTPVSNQGRSIVGWREKISTLQ